MPRKHPMTFPGIQKNRFDKSNHTSPTLTLFTKDVKSTIHIPYQISKQRRFQGNPTLTMFFKSKPIGVNAFFCNTHGSLNPLSLGPVFTDVPPVKGSHVGLGQSLGHQVLQVSLVVSSHFDIQTTYSNLIQN